MKTMKMRNKNIWKDINEGNFQKAHEKSRSLRNVRGKAVCLQNPNRQSFNAVAEVKKGSDNIAKFYIYHINNSMMNDQPDYVFKSSLKMAKVAILMDQTSSSYNALQEEDCYFDGTHTRVKGFKTLALWVFHPGMRCILRLGNNGCKG